MRKNLLWMGVALAALAGAFALQSPYAAYAIYTFLLLVAVAHFSSLAWLSGLDCVRTIDKTTVQQGEEAEVTVTTTNARGWPIPWIYLEDYHPKDCPRTGANKRLAILMPGRSVVLRYRIAFPRRGYHRVGPLLMESGDLFGLQKRFKTGDRQDYVSVLPTVAYIETFNVASKRPQGPVRIQNRIYQDPTRISSIREYVPGDPMNIVHWKATARTGKLHVKTHEPSNVVGGTLILDLHEDSYKPERREERVELAVTTTASIAYLLQVSGEQLGLVTNAQDAAEVAEYDVATQQAVSRQDVDAQVAEEEESWKISPLSVPTMRSPIQAQTIIENLARVVVGRGLDPVRLIMAEFRNLPRDAALLPVLPQVTEELALTLASMKHAGFNVTVFFISDRAGFEEAARLLAPHAIHVFHIVQEWSLHELAPERIGR